MTKHAVILLSGGLDSATTLAIAREEGYHCHALSFDYGQRHCRELEAARRVAESLGVIEHRIAHIDLRAFGGSALTDDIEVPKHPTEAGSDESALEAGSDESARKTRIASAENGEIPVTYVPARNTIFLSFALAYAETIDASDIFIGVNAIDYSGYPDCRPAFIHAFEQMASLGTKRGVEAKRAGRPAIRIHTPLIELSKAQIIRRGTDLGVDYALTLSCYDPPPPEVALESASTKGSYPMHCGSCDACRLRAAGFGEAGILDPAVE